MFNYRQKGYYGEKLAVEYIKERGYQLVRQNYYTRSGEIDIIAWDNKRKELVFIEVKCRTNYSFGYPEEAVDDYKLERMFKCAEDYLRETGYRGVYRFDCLAVKLDKANNLDEVKYYENIS